MHPRPVANVAHRRSKKRGMSARGFKHPLICKSVAVYQWPQLRKNVVDEDAGGTVNSESLSNIRQRLIRLAPLTVLMPVDHRRLIQVRQRLCADVAKIPPPPDGRSDPREGWLPSSVARRVVARVLVVLAYN